MCPNNNFMNEQIKHVHNNSQIETLDPVSPVVANVAFTQPFIHSRINVIKMYECS